uniref:Uncharacterized protein n=1 Tax=Lygus hesperus TaxID=30085 RepID=A0A0A9XLI1_LYGHE
MYVYAIVSIALVGVVYGAPNHLKHVSVEKQAVVNGGSGNLGASASWGPFSAGASLGDAGASAGAQAGSAGAGAGIGGGSTASASASAGAGSSSGVSGGGATIFDQIFNIPISVLKAVNQHVNSKEVVPGAHMAHRRLRKCRRHGICPEGEGVSVQGSAGGSGAQAGAHASAGASIGKEVNSGASADAGAHAGAGSTLTVRKNYDNVFAIPISALTSVNQLLNGKK